MAVAAVCCSWLQMFLAQGMSEQQATVMAGQMQNMSPGMMKFITKATGVVQTGVQAAQQARQYLGSHQVLVIAVVVLLIAVLLRVLGIM
jgi:hypothetical protein